MRIRCLSEKDANRPSDCTEMGDIWLGVQLHGHHLDTGGPLHSRSIGPQNYLHVL
jgi:hypothetical protein